MQNYSLQIKKSKKRKKSISLRIIDAETVQISVPFRYTDKKISEFIQKHTTWIEKNIQKKKEAKTSTLQPHFLGREIQLQAINNLNTTTLKDSILTYPSQLKKPDTLKNFYKKEARRAIPAIAEEESQRMGLKYNKLYLKNQKTRWGSCSSKNNLNFNYLLMQCPPKVIRYVIVHELCHLKHMNHSKKFWNLVEKYDPKYKDHIKELKKYSTQLS